MKITAPLLALFLIVNALTACGDKGSKDEPSGGSGSEDPGEIQMGDGIGTHGVSLETRTEQQIKELIANGADPQKPHTIEHHLSFGTVALAKGIENAKTIIKWAGENGFETSKFDESKVVEGEWIDIDLIKQTKLDLPQIWRDSGLISDLAVSLECEYTGWGCPEIVK